MTPNGPAPADDYARQVDAMQQIKFQAMRNQGLEAMRDATERFQAGATDQALEILNDYKNQLEDSGLEPERVAMLRRPVDSRLQQFKTMKAAAEFDQLAKQKMAMVRNHQNHIVLAEEQKQKQVKELMRQYSALMKEAKYREAEMAAVKARELDPDNQSINAGIYMARTQLHLKQAQDGKYSREELFVNALNEVEDYQGFDHYQGRRSDGLPQGLEGAHQEPQALLRRSRPQERQGKGNRTPPERADHHRVQGHAAEQGDRRSALLQEHEHRHRPGGPGGRRHQDRSADQSEAGRHLDEVGAEHPPRRRPPDLHHRRRSAANHHETERPGQADAAHLPGGGPGHPRGQLHDPGDGQPDPDAGPQWEQRHGQPATERLGAVGHRRGRSRAAARRRLDDEHRSGPNFAAVQQTTTRTPSTNLPAGTRSPGQAQTIEDLLIKLITNTIKPQSWAEVGGSGTIDYFPLGMALVINQTPDVQEQVQELLDALRRLQDLEVSVEVRMISLEEAFFERIGVNFNIADRSQGAAASSSRRSSPSSSRRSTRSTRRRSTAWSTA